MTRFVRRYSADVGPYVPDVVKHNWITILTVVLVAWLSYFSVVLFETSHRATSASDQARQLSHQAKVLSKANQDRINDIQQQRIASCQQNYQSVYDALAPLFPKAASRTAQQSKNLRIFARTIRVKKRNCKHQVLKKPKHVHR